MVGYLRLEDDPCFMFHLRHFTNDRANRDLSQLLSLRRQLYNTGPL